MDRTNITILPHDRLRQKSTKVSQFDEGLRKLVADMTAASLDWEAYRTHEFCVGLAAVQVDVLKKVVVLRENLEDKSDNRFTALVNPKIIKTFGELEEDFEGCLSVANIYGKVKRFSKIKIKAFNEYGEEFRITLEGFPARLVQHEIDHTEGVLFIDHIRDNPDAFFKLEDSGKITKLDYNHEIKDSDELW